MDYYEYASLVPGITTTPLFEGGLRRLTMFATYFNLQAPVRTYETFGLAALASNKAMI